MSDLNFDMIREKLNGKAGKQYWRSLEELSETEEFKAWVDDEFPNRSSLKDIDRRQFLKIMGASIALASLAGCRGVFLDEAKIVPYVKAPEELVPGKPLYYATAMTIGAYALGLLVESHEGRPTKVEGNPDHPASLGATDIFAQASILDHYDPDRLEYPMEGGDLSTWEMALDAFRKQLAKPGYRLAILSEPSSSPTFARQLAALKAVYPATKVYQYESVNRDNVIEGAKMSFGKAVETVYDLSKAKVIVSLDADFITGMPGSVRYARDFAKGRRVDGDVKTMNRLYAVESNPTPTGAAADHRFRVKPSAVEGIAAAIYHAVGASVAGNQHPGMTAGQIDAVAKDLLANKGAAIVIAGDGQSPEVHAIAHSINQIIGAIGSTVKYTESVAIDSTPSLDSIKMLVEDMRSAKVDGLLILGGNPVYDAPADLKFSDALAKVGFKAHHTLSVNETSVACNWQLPATHYLEHWADAKAYDGTLTLTQPLTAPLFESRPVNEFFASLIGKPQSGMDAVRATHPNLASEEAWRTALHDGMVAGSASPALSVQPQAYTGTAKRSSSTGFEVVFAADPSLYDGRWANNSWLQELPKPMTKTLWDNVALMSPATASTLGVTHDDVVSVSVGNATVQAPVWILPGQPDEVLTLHLGHGRTEVGSVGATKEESGKVTSVGFNAQTLRTSKAFYFASGANVSKVQNEVYKVGSTQVHHQMEGRDIVRSENLKDFLSGKHEEHEGHVVDLYPDPVFNYNGPQWGMTIDLSTCTGCNACVVACQAENNIPVVGKDQVIRGREMHWIRIDRYFASNADGPDVNTTNYPDNRGLVDNPEVLFQPVACVHCEKAPCEPVCPVAATIHSHEGLNQMVYNRCVGTRYCSNNCPYKVRRFNFLNYTDNQPQFSTQTFPLPRQNKTSGRELLKMINNPDVTVRGRGVMEKCTYCVQRINDVRIEAKKQGRDPKDGEIVTACEQVCPSQAITFGNINEAGSRVKSLRDGKRAYRLLEEINTKPRTSHLVKLRNPNPELV